MPSLTVAIPALNEENTIRPTVENVLQALRLSKNISAYEIILINDGSIDNTLKVMQSIAGEVPFVRVIDNQGNKGLGYSFARGIQEAVCDYYTWVPSDDTFSGQSLSKLYSQVGNADIIVHYPSSDKRKYSRRIISRLYIRMLNRIFRIDGIKYYNGLSICQSSQIKNISLRSSGFAFQAELLIKLIKSSGNKKNLIQVPVFTTERKYGSTKVFSFKNIIDLLKSIYLLQSDIKKESRK